MIIDEDVYNHREGKEVDEATLKKALTPLPGEGVQWVKKEWEAMLMWMYKAFPHEEGMKRSAIPSELKSKEEER